ncbi:MAG: response regulator [Minisyncoccia bacterium]
MNHQIVLIEDDLFIKQMYSNKIEEININVLTALNKDDLKFILDKNSVNLILLDLILPNISGFDILKWLKLESQFKAVPVIVLSNLSSQADINQAFELEVVDYIVKSNYTPAEVLRTIKKHLPKT